MKRTESEAVSHSGESLVTPYTSTYEETSSRVDVVLKLTSLLFAAGQKHEVGVGILQKKNETNMQFTTENMDTVDTELIPGFDIRMQSEACSIQATFVKEETETEVETHNGR